MIGIDTNVLVRYMTQDDPVQAEKAEKILEKKCTEKSPGFISHIVLCELVWVLSRAYKYEKSLIVRSLNQLVDSAELFVENADIVRQAILDYHKGPADFSDYLIGRMGKENGCKYTVTFDKIAAKSSLFFDIGR